MTIKVQTRSSVLFGVEMSKPLREDSGEQVLVETEELNYPRRGLHCPFQFAQFATPLL
jgi:hypothetical protein